MYRLPLELQIVIYSFDSTFHQIYKTLKIEFLLKLTLWRVHWFNNNVINDSYSNHAKFKLTEFQSTKKGIKFIVNYWNKKHSNCEEEFITDNFTGSNHIFGILKLLKNWTVKEDEIKKNGIKCKKMVLFKPGKI